MYGLWGEGLVWVLGRGMSACCTTGPVVCCEMLWAMSITHVSSIVSSSGLLIFWPRLTKWLIIGYEIILLVLQTCHAEQVTFCTHQILIKAIRYKSTVIITTIQISSAFELPGGLRDSTPQLFSQPPNTPSNYVLRGQLYTKYIWFSSILVGLQPSKVQPPANFSQFKHWIS